MNELMNQSINQSINDMLLLQFSVPQYPVFHFCCI